MAGWAARIGASSASAGVTHQRAGTRLPKRCDEGRRWAVAEIAGWADLCEMPALSGRGGLPPLGQATLCRQARQCEGLVPLRCKDGMHGGTWSTRIRQNGPQADMASCIFILVPGQIACAPSCAIVLIICWKNPRQKHCRLPDLARTSPLSASPDVSRPRHGCCTRHPAERMESARRVTLDSQLLRVRTHTKRAPIRGSSESTNRCNYYCQQ